jgi:anti-sigma B factor antagonist
MSDERTSSYPGDFELRTATRDGTLEVILGGEIDMGAAFRLESSFDAALADEGLGSAVLDLADVTFIDSAGLGALRSMQDRAGQRGVEFSVRSVSDPVQRILDVAGVSAVLDEPSSVARPGVPPPGKR